MHTIFFISLEITAAIVKLYQNWHKWVNRIYKDFEIMLLKELGKLTQ